MWLFIDRQLIDALMELGNFELRSVSRVRVTCNTNSVLILFIVLFFSFIFTLNSIVANSLITISQKQGALCKDNMGQLTFIRLEENILLTI